MLLSPLASVPVAAGIGLSVWAAHAAQLPPVVVGLLAVAASALLTRCMHLDGLADTADGLGAGWNRERALEVMKRGDVGPMGAVALIVVLGLQVASVAALVEHPLLVAMCWLAGRTACPLLAAGPGSATDSGMGAVMTRTVPVLAAAAVTVVAGAALVGVGAQAGLAPLAGVVAAGVALAVVALGVRTCMRCFGGINGDVFGAAIELSTTLLLVVLSAGAWR